MKITSGPRIKRNMLFLVAVATAVIGVCAWWLLRPDASGMLNERLQARAGQVKVLSLSAVPTGFTVLEDSIQANGNIITFSLMYGDNQVAITQQQRPKLMEEVDKQKDVAHPSGKAYVATLDERLVGFLVTDKTLLMVSSTQNLDVNTLEGLLKAFVAP